MKKIIEQPKKTTEKPILKVRSGLVSAAVFEREVKVNEKESFTDYNVVISKSYKDKEDNWQNTNSYNRQDIARLKAVVDKVFTELFIKDEADE